MTPENLNSAVVQSAYDIVGKYSQDQINGFDEDFLESFVKLLDLENAESVLDAMAGDGNLTRRMINYCSCRNIDVPSITLLEYSSVQTELARASIDSERVSIVNGDVLSMTDLESGEKLPTNYFDRVVIKSGNHEIRAEKQYHLYERVFEVLKPGGVFINLGFLFNDVQERDEFTQITNVKNNLIGARDTVANRHFLMREELYGFLNSVGFKEAKEHTTFEYVIRSEIVEKEYFSNLKPNAAIEARAAQERATTLRNHRRIFLDANRSIMRIPGEITIAIKPEQKSGK